MEVRSERRCCRWVRGVVEGIERGIVSPDRRVMKMWWLSSSSSCCCCCCWEGVEEIDEMEEEREGREMCILLLGCEVRRDEVR